MIRAIRHQLEAISRRRLDRFRALWLAERKPGIDLTVPYSFTPNDRDIRWLKRRRYIVITHVTDRRYASAVRRPIAFSTERGRMALARGRL